MGTSTPEQVLDKEIMIWCGQRNWLCFHTNVGKIRFYDEQQGQYRYFDTGLPKGWPDLMIITDYGEVMYCETKIHPRKPTDDQIKVINILRSRKIRAFVSFSLKEFIESAIINLSDFDFSKIDRGTYEHKRNRKEL